MIRTGVNGNIEHLAAYPVCTLLAVLAYPRWSPRFIGGALVIYAAILEIGQIFVPGRHSQFENFAASCVGIAVIIIPSLWLRRISLPTRTE